MKMFKNICIWATCIIAFLVVSAVVLVSVYEDEVTAYAVEEIAKTLKTDVNVGEVNLTLWNQFPSASLEFSNVFIEETFEEKDTLIYAKSVFLNFSISDLISGNYEVNEIAINDSKLRLKRAKNGEDNYHFWKTSDEESAKFSLAIDQIHLTNSHVSYDDKASETDLKLTANDCLVNATITDETLDFTGDIDTQLHLLEVSHQAYVEDKSVNGLTSLHIDLASNVYSFSETDLKINSLPLNISGTLDLSKKLTGVDLVAQTNSAQLQQVVNNLPGFIKRDLAGFETQGNFDCHLKILGNAGSGSVPDISGSYAVSNGVFRNNSTGVALDEISAKGSYSAPFKRDDLLVIENLSCALEGDQIKGSGKISRLSSPFINVQTSGNIDLENLNDLLNLSEIESLAGLAEIELNYKGNLGKNWQPSAQNLSHADLSGRVNVKDVLVKLKSNEHLIEDISGDLVFNAGEAKVSELNGLIEDSDFTFNGSFTNVLGYLLVPGEKLKVSSTLTSNKIDLNSLLSSSSSDSEEDYEFNLPSHIDLSLNAQVGALDFQSFHASNIATQATISAKSLKLSNLNMNLADGAVKGRFVATQAPSGDFKISSNGQINRVDISELFENFEDFHQDFITHEHLKGIATTDFSFNADMSSALELNSESIRVDADVTLANGELINHSTLLEIGQYIKDKKLLGALMNANEFQNKLKHVRFSELKNQIQIRNGMVSIPKMSIESDALNIQAEGNHSFENQIDYSVGFDIADLTAREGLEEDEKGLSKHIFISMTGNTDAPEFSYDRLAVKEERKENRKEEVHKIRELVKQEFSSKTKVSSGTKEEEKEPHLKVDWKDKKETDKKEGQPVIVSEPEKEEEDEDDDF